MLGIQWKEQCLTNVDFADGNALLGDTKRFARDGHQEGGNSSEGWQ